VSRARSAPRARQPAGRAKAAATGKGSPRPGGTPGKAAAGAARTKTFPASRCKRPARRRGKNRALVAAGNSILTIIWHLLPDPSAHFTDPGPGWHDRLAPLRRNRQLITGLERLSGKKVTLQDTV
jgi:transposase